MTNNDVKRDIELIFQNLSNGENSVPSPFEALKISAIFPITCLALYALSLSYIVHNFVPPDDIWVNPLIHYLGGMLAFGGFTLLLSLAFVAMLYTPSLIFVSIPCDIRSKSFLMKKLSRFYKTGCKLIIAINGAFALFAAIYPDAFYAAPFVFLLSYLIMQGMISSEITRYGLSSVIGKLRSLSKNI
jgi:hypothetical protein